MHAVELNDDDDGGVRRRTDDDFLCLITSPMKGRGRARRTVLWRAPRHSARSNCSRGMDDSISCSASVQSLRQRRMKEEEDPYYTF